jgi:Mg-chelatase subunit ChlD
LQRLLPMTAANKRLTKRNIDGMRIRDATNLWHGIKDGLNLFLADPDSNTTVQAMMVLTDGQPNHM